MACLNGKREVRKFVKLANHLEGSVATDTLHQKQCEDLYCTPQRCAGSIMMPPIGQKPAAARSTEEILRLAKDFSNQYFESKQQQNTEAHELCWSTVEREIHETGHYELIEDELLFGAKTAWRNAQRCIARIQWQTLKVFDARKVETTQGMFEAILRHLRYAASAEGIPSTMTVFRHRSEPGEDFRIWNAQLVRYAGFTQDDGSIIGDPASAELTDICIKLGWKPKIGPFVVLPLVLSVFGRDPDLYEIPEEDIKHIPLTHPEYPKFAEMGLQWYTVPAVSNMLFDVGGIMFPACAFSGCYTNPEIARNMCDSNRYNVMEKLATEVLNLDTSKVWNLWKDRVFLEVNKAVLHSLQSNNITVIDHHSASESFVRHLKNEQKLRGGCPADWVWIVPPIGGSLLSVFHQEMLDYRLTPSFCYQPNAWVGHVFKDAKPKVKYHFRGVASAVIFSAKLMMKVQAKRPHVTIVYATETGRSERYARALADVFKHGFVVRFISADQYNVVDLATETLLLVVTSTFGNGDPPDNGKRFGENLQKLTSRGATLALKYSVFGLGSSAYPHFCTFAHQINQSLKKLSGAPLMEIQTGDEINGQDQSFKKWAEDVLLLACQEFNVTEGSSAHIKESLTQGGTLWSVGAYQLSVVPNDAEHVQLDLKSALAQTHHKDVSSCILAARRNLQSAESPRQTILVELELSNDIDVTYEPGDHVAIFVENDKSSVSLLLSRLDQPASGKPVHVEKMVETISETKEKERLPYLPLHDLLTSFLDITTPPSQTFLSCLASLASLPEERDILVQLAQSTEKYEEWKRFRWPTLLEVLDQFPSVKLDPTLLLMELPLLQPRFYSISSSPLVAPKQIHLTAAVLSYETQGGQGPLHHGVCSSFLNSTAVGQEIHFYLRRTPTFRLPEDKTVPIYLVGAGAGIAPFRGFWQELETRMTVADAPQEVMLIFGCRNLHIDDIYQDEIQRLLKSSVLKDFHLALSREPGQRKVYVQDVISTIPKALFQDITHRAGQVYVCGDVGMAAGVQAAIQQVCIAEGMSTDEAVTFLEDLRISNRYHEDIFGNYKASSGH